MKWTAETFLILLKDLCETVVAVDTQGTHYFHALTQALWQRLDRAAARFAVLARHLVEFGPFPKPKPRRKPEQKPAPKPRSRPEMVLPGRFGWASRGWNTQAHAARLTELLANPDTIALIEADPRFGRILRPLCRLLGIRPPPCLQRPRQRQRVRRPSSADLACAAARREAERQGAILQASKPTPAWRRIVFASVPEPDPHIYHQLYFHRPPRRT